MSVGTADLQKAIVTAWNASTLNDSFAALGGIAPILNDQEVTPGQAYPYCVLPQSSLNINTRMSSTVVNTNRYIQDIEQSFIIHTSIVDGDSRTAKEIAAFLVEEVMKVFGGHPTVASTPLTLDNGNHLITQYQRELPVRTGDDQYQWNIDYNFRIDIPVMS